MYVTSNQINFIYFAQNHNRITSMGFTICTVNDILCPTRYITLDVTYNVSQRNSLIFTLDMNSSP